MKLLIERSHVVAARDVFLKATHRIKQCVSDMLITVINPFLLRNLPQVSAPHTLETTVLGKALCQ